MLKNLSLAFLLVSGIAEARDLGLASPFPVEETPISIGTQADGSRVYGLRETLLHTPYDDAQKYCEGLVKHGHDDWAIPTREQVDLLEKNRGQLDISRLFTLRGGFLERWFWSTEKNAEGQHYTRDMVTGKSAYIDKKYPLTTLCMRVER